MSIPKRLEVVDTDNRDESTTTLTLSDGSTVDVNPIELVKNMIDNCFDSDVSMTDTSTLDDLIDYITQVRTDRT